MIKRFASKVLRRAFEDGNYRRINPQWRTRVELLLDALDAAEKVEDLNLLTLGTHPLKGNRKGEWGMTRDEELEDYLQIRGGRRRRGRPGRLSLERRAGHG